MSFIYDGPVIAAGTPEYPTNFDALEAIFGAVFLDSGFDAATTIVERIFAPRLELLPDAAKLRDPKTRLQELLQGRGLPLPSYEVMDVRGAPHEQHFRVCCRVESDHATFVGEGPSRRRAEQAAAVLALSTLGQDDNP